MPSYGTIYIGDEEQLEQEKWHLQIAYIVHLPFRLRMGGLHCFAIKGQYECEVWVYNRLQIPEGTGLKSARQNIKPEDASESIDTLLLSEAVVIVRNVTLTEKDRQLVFQKKWCFLSEERRSMARYALNQVIAAYYTQTKELYGGWQLHLLGDGEFDNHNDQAYAIVTPDGHLLSDEEVMRLINKEYKIGVPQLNLTRIRRSHIDDFDSDCLTGIERQLARQADHIFYEYAFQARSALESQEYPEALLAAVIALEGAHAAIVKEGIAEHMNGSGIDSEGLANDLLREQGISTLLRLTPYLFMDARFRPSPGDIKSCQNGITLRNGIMHAKTKNGRPAVRDHTNEKLIQACNAVLTVYDKFVAQMEAKG